MQLALLDILQTYSSSKYDGGMVISMIYASAVLVKKDFIPQFIPKIDKYLIYTKNFIIFVILLLTYFVLSSNCQKTFIFQTINNSCQLSVSL